MDCAEIVFSGHAIRRMFERGLSTDDAVAVNRSGEVIASYPDDTPFPSFLMLGFVRGLPLHVVVGVDEAKGAMSYNHCLRA